MLFSGLTLLYGFLPAVLALYFPAPKKLKNGVLLLASLFFYAWGEPRLAWLMLVTIGVFYLCGLAIGRAKSGKAKKAWLALPRRANRNPEVGIPDCLRPNKTKNPPKGFLLLEKNRAENPWGGSYKIVRS